MSDVVVYAVAAVVVVAVGLTGLLTSPSLLRRILALNIMGSGIFLLLVALAGRNSAAGPDPVPHAMVLTGIVVAVSTTALALAIARRLIAETGVDGLPDEHGEIDG
jgi:multicomponent Na+:H+ antiporter subunit C